MALCFGYSHQNLTLDEVYLRQMEAVDRFPHQESFFIKRELGIFSDIRIA